MKLERAHLTTLLNALADVGESTVTVAHPSEEIGELLEFELGDHHESTVRFTQGRYTYQDNREEVQLECGERAYEDLPQANEYVRALVAGGLVDVRNRDDIDEFVNRWGYPDLRNGDDPVYAAFDTNLFELRIPDALGLDPVSENEDDRGRVPVNGYALATGVKAELDWHYKHYDTAPLEEHFGPEFEMLQDQPAGENRQGLLGLYEYRRLDATRPTDIIQTGEGDDAIIEGYRQYADEQRNVPLLFSNDKGFVETARDEGLYAQRVKFYDDLPSNTTATWAEIETTLYVLTLFFGVLQLPAVTLYGVWDDKDGHDWEQERIRVVPRSEKIEPILERGHNIVNTHDATM